MKNRVCFGILLALLVGCTTTGEIALAREEEILEQLYDRQGELQLCQFNLDRERSREVSNIYPLGEEKYLVELLCFMAAYQGAYEYYLVEEMGSELMVRPLSLAVFAADAAGEWRQEESREIAGLPEFDRGDRILTVYYKGNGLGTCGSLARYRLEGEGFQLLNYRAKWECGDRYLDPEDYPQIYP